MLSKNSPCRLKWIVVGGYTLTIICSDTELEIIGLNQWEGVVVLFLLGSKAYIFQGLQIL